MTTNALINVATGAVLEWGAIEYVPGPGQAVVKILDNGMTFPARTPNHYVKVMGGFFQAMTAKERAAVDLVIPQRRAQRFVQQAETAVTTSETSPGGGWGDMIPPTAAKPLVAGPYQIVCGFELALLVNSTEHTAQARLEIDGVEVATWHNPRSAYSRCQFIETIAFAQGTKPTFRLQIRRLGVGPGTARGRRGSISLSHGSV